MVDRRALLQELLANDPGLGPTRNPMRLSPKEMRLMLELQQQESASPVEMPAIEQPPAEANAPPSAPQDVRPIYGQGPSPFMPSGNYDPTPGTPYTQADHFGNLASRAMRNVVPGGNWITAQALGDRNTPGQTPADLQRQYHDHDESFAEAYPWQSFGADIVGPAIAAGGVAGWAGRQFPARHETIRRFLADRGQTTGGLATVGASHGATDEYLDNPYATAESVGGRAASGALGGVLAAPPVHEVMIRLPGLLRTMAGTVGRQQTPRVQAPRPQLSETPRDAPLLAPTSRQDLTTTTSPTPQRPQPDVSTDPNRASPSPIPQEPRYTQAHSKIAQDGFQQVFDGDDVFGPPTKAQRAEVVSALQSAFARAGLDVPSASNINNRLGSTVRALLDFKRAGADITDPRVVRRAFGGPGQLAVPLAIGAGGAAAMSEEEQRQALLDALLAQ